MGRLTKRVRKQRSSTRHNKRKRGGCGCGLTGGKGKNKKSKTNKNKRKVKGGSQHLASLPLRYYYPLNEHESNLSVSYGHVSSHDGVFGGKKKKSIKKRKMKGGGMLESIFNGPQLNVTTGFGTSVGTKMLYDVQSLNNQQDNNVLNQPAGQLYNAHSPLLA